MKTPSRRRRAFAGFGARALGGAGITAACLLALAAVALAADLLTVVQRETSIRKEKRLLSAKVATVKEGDQVTRLDEEESWYRVEFNGAEGWLPKTAVSTDRKIVLSNQAVSSGVRATEQSAGARGFNPEVEGQFRATRTDLNEAYKIVDRIQATKYPEDGIARFMRDGKLSEDVASAAPAKSSEANALRPSAVRPPWAASR